MSRALWEITAFVSRAWDFISFSCSMGSLSAVTPRLPKPVHWEDRIERPDLVGRSGHPPAQRRVREAAQQLGGSDHATNPQVKKFRPHPRGGSSKP